MQPPGGVIAYAMPTPKVWTDKSGVERTTIPEITEPDPLLMNSFYLRA